MKPAKFEIRELLPIGMTLVVAGIGVAYGLNVMAGVRDGMCSYGYSIASQKCKNSTGGTGGVSDNAEVNATEQAIIGVATLPSKFPMLATIIIAAVILGVLIRYLVVR